MPNLAQKSEQVPLMSEGLGDLVSIYIEPKNSDKYFVDMEHVEAKVTIKQEYYIQQ